jgi:hypothetical protein
MMMRVVMMIIRVVMVTLLLQYLLLVLLRVMATLLLQYLLLVLWVLMLIRVQVIMAMLQIRVVMLQGGDVDQGGDCASSSVPPPPPPPSPRLDEQGASPILPQHASPERLRLDI